MPFVPLGKTVSITDDSVPIGFLLAVEKDWKAGS
jgi:hypothetical protein